MGKSIKEQIKEKLTVDNTVAFLKDLGKVNEKSLAEVALETFGKGKIPVIPLPSQSEAYNFYVSFEGLKDGEEPSSKLATIDPKSWTGKQYLKYQVDVKKFRLKSKFEGAKDAVALRKIKLQLRLEQLARETLADPFKDFNDELQSNMEKNTPKDMKARGIQKFPELLDALLKVVVKYSYPTVIRIFDELGIGESIDDKKQKLLEKLTKKLAEKELEKINAEGILDQLPKIEDGGKRNDIIKSIGITQLEIVTLKLKIKTLDKESVDLTKEDLCPTSLTLDKIITERNGLVDYLNNTQDKLNITVKGINITGTTAESLQTTSNIIRATNLIATAAATVLLFIPGKIILAINTLESFRQTLITANDGNSKISPLVAVVNNVNIPLNALSALITQLVLALGQIDEVISVCRPNATLTNLSPEVLLTVALELSAEVSENEFLYKGFRLEIETKPYTDAVNQNRAVGKNQSGIVMITTEYSFASDPNVLINELKFIIDRDGLKAY